MAVSSSNVPLTRASADPRLTVAEIQHAIAGVLKAHKSELCDVAKLQISWKSSPSAEQSDKHFDLLKAMLSIAPNGLLPQAKLRAALQALACDSGALPAAMHTDSQYDKVAFNIRMLLGKIRNCTSKEEVMNRCLRKASQFRCDHVILVHGVMNVLIIYACLLWIVYCALFTFMYL